MKDYVRDNSVVEWPGQFGGIGNTIFNTKLLHKVNWENGFPQLLLGRPASELQIQELVISSALKSLQSMGNKLVCHNKFGPTHFSSRGPF